MSINYALFPNRLTGEENQYRAVTKLNGSQDLESIIRQMMLQGSTVTEADIRAVLTEAIRAAANMLIQGQRVNFGGLVQLWPGITGKFQGKGDHYDRTRHQIRINTSAGKSIVEEVRRIAEPSKTLSAKPAPILFDFIDNATGAENQSITGGEIGSIVGNRLKFNPEQPDEGIFIINTADLSEVRIAKTQRNKPGELVFLVPGDLTKGAQFRIEVRVRLPRTEDLRKGELEYILQG